jgi:plastocyanin
MNFRSYIGVLAAGGVVLASQVSAATAAAPSKLVIGVDHLDPANQDEVAGRLFEYTDFFSRSVKVHQGDTLDFRFYPPPLIHVIALAKTQQLAEKTHPLHFVDTDDPPSVATGKPKIIINPAVVPRGSGCGWTTPCVYPGGNDVEISGRNQGTDWQVTVDASPGTYTYFCYIHPGMRGRVEVVGPEVATTTQAENDVVSERQFQHDRNQALRAEQAANVVRYSGDDPGERTYFVKVGIGAADKHVAIDEMLPNQPLNLVSGDRVLYTWADGHQAHSVTFPPDSVPDRGWDCATYTPAPPGPPPCTEPGEGPELIRDPGNAPSGTALTTPTQIVDAGVRLGRDYGLPTTIHWAVSIDDGTLPGSYAFNCTLHDWMKQNLNVSRAPKSGDRGDQAKF